MTAVLEVHLELQLGLPRIASRGADKTLRKLANQAAAHGRPHEVLYRIFSTLVEEAPHVMVSELPSGGGGLMRRYLNIAEGLAKDGPDSLPRVLKGAPESARNVWRATASKVIEHARSVTTAASEEVRKFAYANLRHEVGVLTAIQDLTRRFGWIAGKEVRVAYTMRVSTRGTRNRRGVTSIVDLVSPEGTPMFIEVKTMILKTGAPVPSTYPELLAAYYKNLTRRQKALHRLTESPTGVLRTTETMEVFGEAAEHAGLRRWGASQSVTGIDPPARGFPGYIVPPGSAYRVYLNLIQGAQ